MRSAVLWLALNIVGVCAGGLMARGDIVGYVLIAPFALIAVALYPTSRAQGPGA